MFKKIERTLKKIVLSVQIFYEIKVMINSFIDMLKLSNFGHMTMSTI